MIPVILNSPEPMVKVRVITLKDYSEQALKTLHKVGVLHVEQGEELKPVDKAAIEGQQKEVSELLAFVGGILGYITEKQQVSPGEDVEVIYTRPFGEIGREVRSLYTRFAELYQKAVKINEEIKALTEQKRYLGALTQHHDIRLRDLKFSGDYLFSRVFILPTEAYETLHDELEENLLESAVGAVDNETVVYAIGKRENLEAVESLVGGAEGKILPIPDRDLTLGEFLEKSEGELHRLEEKSTELYQELQGKVGQELKRIALLRGALIAENQRLSVLTKACEAKYVTLVGGWVPEDNLESTVFELRKNVDYVFIDTRRPEPSEEPPTKMKNPTPLRPFQVIVNLFAIPKYREWDPTPIIAYSFAFFFGLMLSDVVYAVGIMLGTRFFLPKLVDDRESEGFKLFQRVLYISSGVGLISGLMTGTYLGDFYRFFGVESLALSAGVERILGNPITFIMLSLLIGLIHMNIGHMLALIRGIKERQKGVVPNKIGIFGLQICGIPIMLHTILRVDIPLLTTQTYSILGYALVASLVLVIASSVRQKGIFLGGLFWIFDITGLLGDIMSYSRLAGVGLATFYLATVFNMMAEWLPTLPFLGAVIGGIVAVVILIFGHLINMMLAGLACFIHSLRLCFVEFLFKFYEGGGREFSPFILRKRPSVLIGVKS